MTTPPLPSEIQTHVNVWRLRADGPQITTRSSWVLPVMFKGTPAMLKVARTADERSGYRLMEWWEGDGAAKVLASTEDALLLERAHGRSDLAEMARTGHDDAACAILCRAAARLHRPRRAPLPALHPLKTWFGPLFSQAVHHAVLAPAASAAQALLSSPREILPLHGDLHHGNVLDFADRGWLAIDPHGLLGERLFDFANIFTNPDLDDRTRPVATLPGRFERRLTIVAAEANAERARLLQWVIAWTGLSAAWFIGDEDHEGAAIDLAVNAIAVAAQTR